ncbi:MAG: hypothetical protein UHS51_09015, partial [Atopobiaceae bacterium]|nr:hypothetical protein [Atopobiaceae bacterium]
MARHMAHSEPKKRGRRSPLIPIRVFLLLLGLIGTGGYFLYQRLTTISITVNGQQVTTRTGQTVEGILKEGYANPQAGDLLAVDGSLIAEGQGSRCSVTVNGNAADVSTPLAANA